MLDNRHLLVQGWGGQTCPKAFALVLRTFYVSNLTISIRWDRENSHSPDSFSRAEISLFHLEGFSFLTKAAFPRLPHRLHGGFTGSHLSTPGKGWSCCYSNWRSISAAPPPPIKNHVSYFCCAAKDQGRCRVLWPGSDDAQNRGLGKISQSRSLPISTLYASSPNSLCPPPRRSYPIESPFSWRRCNSGSFSELLLLATSTSD